LLRVYKNPFGKTFREEFVNKYEEYTWQILKEANLFIDGKVDVFGIECSLDDLLNDIDPTTNEKWPQKHYKEYWFHAGAAPGDVKFTWEYMKHNFLISLGKAHVFTQDEIYVKKAMEYIEKWLEKTDDWIGVSWVGHVHMCQRMVNWFSWLDMCKDSPLFNAGFYAKVDAYIRKQQELLEKEYPNPRNNHKLVSIVTIILCYLHFAEADKIEPWLARLKETVEELLYEDGGFVEQSVSYHRLCVEALLLLGLSLVNHGYPVPEFITNAIERSLIYFDAITTPDGMLPIIGDNSNEILIVRPTDFWESEYLFQLALALGINVRTIDRIDPDALFYLGEIKTGEKPYQDRKSFAFSKTGHYVIKEGRDYAFLRAGEFGFYAPNSKAGHPHSHCDQLGVVLYLGGNEILTDPGTYRYNENDFERMIMKDESFHSTFLVDDIHQARYTSSFSYDDAIDGLGKIVNDKIVAELAIGGVLAKRTVSLSQGSCIIEDDYTPEDGQKHNLQIFFCLSPRFSIVKCDKNRVLLQHIGSRRYLAIDHDTDTIANIKIGYVSREYNQARPNQHLVFALPLNERKNFTFRFHYVPNK
jgi:hypothetical protein